MKTIDKTDYPKTKISKSKYQNIVYRSLTHISVSHRQNPTVLPRPRSGRPADIKLQLEEKKRDHFHNQHTKD